MIPKIVEVVEDGEIRDKDLYAKLALLFGHFQADPNQITRAYAPPNLDPRDMQPIINVAAKYKLIEKAFDARELIAQT